MILLFRSMYHILFASPIDCIGECVAESVSYARVHLHATDQSALQNGVTMDVLKKFSAEPEVEGSGGRLYQEPKTPETPGGIARETH